MDYASLIARWIVHRPKTLWAILLMVVICCTTILVRNLRLDTEVLNLLPDGYESVSALRLYNSGFEQARELTFVLTSTGDPDALEAFEEEFVPALTQEPWMARFFYRAPIETEEGRANLDAMALPMLLNLEREAFVEAMALLEPERLKERIATLRERMDSPSPTAEMQLELDPTGLVSRALAPLVGEAPLERGQPMVSDDGLMRLILVVTNQKELNDRASKALMVEVHRFIEAQMTSWNEGLPEAEQVLVEVTGRSAFVDEISSSMQSDLAITMASSILLVCVLFYIAFRRLSPLLGIGSVLLVACLIAMTMGALIFGELNILTIGFCSILIGLGVDFGVLLYADYQETYLETGNREEAIASAVGDLSKSILYGAMTTGLAFLALILSDSQGFTQLGVLIATGVASCALLMLSVLFLLIHSKQPQIRNDWLLDFARNFLGFVSKKARWMAMGSGAVLVACVAIAAWPGIPVPLDANPRNLEPQSSAAGQALRKIESRLARSGEPFLLLLKSDSPADAYADWQKLGDHLEGLVDEGLFHSAYTPQALQLNPERINAHAAVVGEVDLAEVREAFEAALVENGMRGEAFESTRELFAQLEQVADQANSGATQETDWRKRLPENSSWRFLIDRYFGADPELTVAFVTPKKKITTFEERSEIRDRIEESGVPAMISGWSFTIIDLMPWTKQELYGLSGLIGGVIAVLLIVSYRDWRMWSVHCLALVLAVTGMMTTLKLFDIPLTLLNVLAFPLILGVGVDYGLHTLLAHRHRHAGPDHVSIVLKSVILGAFTTIAGFGSLVWANNPSLSSLGGMCAIGVGWCLLANLLFLIPCYHLFCRKKA